MASPGIADLTLWWIDNAPPIVFEFPFDIAGSDFALMLRFGGRILHRMSADGDLAIDPAQKRVTWAYSPADFEGLPSRSGVYELRRIVPVIGGETRTYVAGSVTIRSVI